MNNQYLEKKSSLKVFIVLAIMALGLIASTGIASATLSDAGEPRDEVTSPSPEETSHVEIVTPAAEPAPDEASTTETRGTPTIWSDKPDYEPGEFVQLSGEGWVAGETVHINVEDDQDKSWSRDSTVTADDDGKISDSFNLPQRFIATYFVTAVGEISGQATHGFTDGTLKIQLANVSAQPPGIPNLSTVTWTTNYRGYGGNNASPAVGNTNCANLTSQFTDGVATMVGYTATNATGIGNGQSAKPLSLAGIPGYTINYWAKNADGTGKLENTGGYFDTVAGTCIPSSNNPITLYAVLKSSTVPTTLTVSSASGSYGGTASLTATLSPAIAGKTINFSLNGSSRGTATTNSSGVATVSAASLSGINAGTYATGVGASFAGDATHVASSGSAQLAVSKLNSSVSINWNDSTFNGSANAATASATGADNVSLGSATLTYYSGTTATGSQLSGAPSAAGTYTVQAAYAASSNYNGSTNTKTITISKAASSTTANWSNSTFSGTPNSATGSVSGVGSPAANLGSPTFTYYSGPIATGTPLGGAPTNAGTYTVVASFAGNTNYNSSSDNKTITISKATAFVSVNAYDVVYDGNPRTSTGTATGVAGTDLSSGLTLSGTTHTNAGTYVDGWSFSGGANYQDASGTVNNKIDKASSTVTVTCPTSVTYTGSAKTPCSATVTGAGGLSESVTVSYSDNTNAGPATASASYAGDANHSGDSDSTGFTIDKANATIDVTGYTETYDGQPHTATGTATGVENEDLSSLLDLSGTTHTNAGTYTADTWRFAGNGNYNIDNGTVNDKINKASSSVSITWSNSTYDGGPNAASASASGVGGVLGSASLTYYEGTTELPGAPTSVGTYKVVASYAGNDNHESSSNDKTITIAKAATTTTVTCPASVNYNGSAQSPCTARVTGPGGLDQNLTVTHTDNTMPGTATASASFAGADNHEASSGSGSFTIACPLTAAFQAPLKDGARNTVKVGSVVPVKVKVTNCLGEPVLDKTLSIRLLVGIVEAGDVDDGRNVLEQASVSSADTTGLMRVSEGHYIYNLNTKGLTAGTDYTFAVKDTTGATWETSRRILGVVFRPTK